MSEPKETVSQETLRTVMLQIGSVMDKAELRDVAQTLHDFATAPQRPSLMLIEDYTFMRYLPRVGWCGVHCLLYHWTVHYKIEDSGIGGRFCFKTEEEARAALREWDGYGDMPGRWHKHPPTSRRRDPDTGEIWREADDHKRRQRMAEEASK